MFPLPSTRPITTPDEFVTDPSARTLKPPADAPPVAPLIAPPTEPPPIEPPDEKPRRTIEPAELTTLPDPSRRPRTEPDASRTNPSAPIE